MPHTERTNVDAKWKGTRAQNVDNGEVAETNAKLQFLKNPGNLPRSLLGK